MYFHDIIRGENDRNKRESKGEERGRAMRGLKGDKVTTQSANEAQLRAKPALVLLHLYMFAIPSGPYPQEGGNT